MNKYMKFAKELSDENLKTNAGGPFGMPMGTVLFDTYGLRYSLENQ